MQIPANTCNSEDHVASQKRLLAVYRERCTNLSEENIIRELQLLDEKMGIIFSTINLDHLGGAASQGFQKRHHRALKSRRVRAVAWERHENNIYDKIQPCTDLGIRR